MNGSIDTPPHVKLAQDKAEWDAKQKAKQKKQTENTQYVIVTELDIPFSKLVGFGKVGNCSCPCWYYCFHFLEHIGWVPSVSM
ncbi:MAG: hypothetical protein M8357_13360 [Desulfobulbaceae bacterium]|nr:hypothetical protein [Desulfobulbaceae bacterium]